MFLCVVLHAVELLFLDLRFHSFFLNAQSQTEKQAHVNIGDPDQREERHQIAAPILVEQTEMRDDQDQRRHVKTKTILTGENIEELAGQQPFAFPATTLTPGPWLGKDFLVRHRPCNDRHRQSQQQKMNDLTS